MTKKPSDTDNLIHLYVADEPTSHERCIAVREEWMSDEDYAQQQAIMDFFHDAIATDGNDGIVVHHVSAPANDDEEPSSVFKP